LCGHFGFNTDINPGTFALVGAASFLGGIARMTISLTVILVESTDDITYAVPIMLCLMVAKWVGDLFNEGIYDTHIDIRHIPFLKQEPPLAMRRYRACDVMNRPVVCFQEVESVATVYKTLTKSKHNGFPIISTNGTFSGLILRSQLITLLKKKTFSSDQKLAINRIGLEDFRGDYPRYPKIDTVELTNFEKGLSIDLAPYMNQTPYLIQSLSPLSRVYRLFRTMGMRHLVVVDSTNKVVGMITRTDLCNLEYIVEKRKSGQHNAVGTNTVHMHDSVFFGAQNTSIGERVSDDETNPDTQLIGLDDAIND